MRKIKLITLTAGLALGLAACSAENEKVDTENSVIKPSEEVKQVIENKDIELPSDVVEEQNNSTEIEEKNTIVEPVTNVEPTTKKEEPITSTPIKEVVKKVPQIKEEKVYIAEGTNYRGYGENIDTVLEEYSADKKVYGIYYIGEEPILDSKVSYKIIEERGLASSNPSDTGTVVLKDNYARITINCNGACADFPNQIRMNFEYATNQVEDVVEEYSLEKYTE